MIRGVAKDADEFILISNFIFPDISSERLKVCRDRSPALGGSKVVARVCLLSRFSNALIVARWVFRRFLLEHRTNAVVDSATTILRRTKRALRDWTSVPGHLGSEVEGL